MVQDQITRRWDLFISHASEDKATVARPLAEILIKLGLRVWYDEFSLSLGDSLRRKIDHGLGESRFGLVILSKSFFAKEWPQRELDGLVAREIEGLKVILPVWHGVTRTEVSRFSAPLADKLAANTELGLDAIAAQIAAAISQAVEASPSDQVSTSVSLRPERSATRRSKHPLEVNKKSSEAAISTGSTLLDAALGTAGWPIGFVSQIYGPSGSGKSTLALLAIRQCQLAGKIAAYVDADRVQTEGTLSRFGVNFQDLLVSSPTTLDELIDITLTLVRSKQLGLIVVDSIASLPCQFLLDEGAERMTMEPSVQRQMIFRFAEHLASCTRDGTAAVLLVNRVVVKEFVMFGNPEDIPWFTQPLKDLISLSVDVRRRQTMKDGDRIAGFEMGTSCVKNRFVAPFRKAQFFIDYRDGILDQRSLVEAAISMKVLNKRNRTFSFLGRSLGRSYDDLVTTLESDGELYDKFRSALLNELDAG